MPGLVNRERELARFEGLWRRPEPALMLLYGRRRVGKTFFLRKALTSRTGVYFLAAESSAVENLVELLAQVRRTFPERGDATITNYPTWRVVFRLLADLARHEPLIVVLDEFSYLVQADPAIPSLLQAVWDQDAPGTHLKLVLCGSEIGLLAALDDYGRPLHGRFDWIERYRPLDYFDAARFLTADVSQEERYSSRDLLLAYGLLGGSGRYLAEIDPRQSLAANLARVLLDPSGVFQREGENLIRQERGIRDYAAYNAVLEAIATGATDWGEIGNQAHVEKHTVAGCLERLRDLGWVIFEKPFEEPDRRGLYRLADNFLKSWYRYVFRFRSALQMARPESAWSQLVAPDLDNYMGQQVFETVSAQYLARFARERDLPLVVEFGRWWNRQSSIEIDLVAKLADGGYLFGECKWARSPIDLPVLFDLHRKVAETPHGRWKEQPRFALFSAAGFTPRLTDYARDAGALLVGPAEFFAGL